MVEGSSFVFVGEVGVGGEFEQSAYIFDMLLTDPVGERDDIIAA